MGNQEIINSIKYCLQSGPKSISDVAEQAKINWRTAEDYLRILESLGIVKEIRLDKKSRTFCLMSNNLFKLYVRPEDQKYISTVYHYIKQFCKKHYNKDPSKTQAYKILWKVNNSMPVGWYLYGPCCVQVYQNNEEALVKLSSKELQTIQKATLEYCACENFALQKKVYADEKNKLYLTKEDLLAQLNDKDKINSLLMDLIKFAPEECADVVTDFARAALLRGIERTRDCFINFVWKYIAMVEFKRTLKHYYEDLSPYFDECIADAKNDAQLGILEVVRCTQGKQLLQGRRNLQNA